MTLLIGIPGPHDRTCAPEHEVAGPWAHPGELGARPGDQLPGGWLAVEAVAPHGTTEAVRVQGTGFPFAVQWHPEWGYA